MSAVSHLRQEANLCRRLAGIRTAGGHHEDRVLLDLADELERKAEELEGRDRRHYVIED